MKKIMALLTVLMCFASTNVFAQLKEVRGVQTRLVEYRGNEEAYGVGNERHGFEFKNENGYAVWVDAELWSYPYSYRTPDPQRSSSYEIIKDIEECIRATKSFRLSTGETYVWKCGDQILCLPGVDNEYCHEKFYVKYKAYKADN